MKAGEHPPEDIYVFIEIPRGSNIKCEYDKEMQVLKIDRILHTAAAYPFNYGFIPETMEEDNDPIDCVIIAFESYPHGVLVRAKPIGMLITEDEHGIDRKILAVPHHNVDPKFAEIEDFKDVQKSILDQIRHFFQHYKELEEGKWVKIIGFEDSSAAKRTIMRAIKRKKLL